MRYVPNDKYTIAWFKLAECVAKGEKEKAFGVYRLLKHSLEDQAYAHQLEGDLFGAFGDQKAVETYAYAAQLYQHNHRYKEAIALYEELIFLAPGDDRYLTRTIDLYKTHKSPDVFVAKLRKIAQLLAQKQMQSRILYIADALQNNIEAVVIIELYTQGIIGLIQNQPNLHECIENALKKAIQFILNNKYEDYIQTILTALHDVSEPWHEKAKEYIANV